MSDETNLELSPAELAERIDAGEVEIVDVRTDEEWAEGRIAGSRHVVLDELTAAADTIDRDRAVVFVCSGGNRSGMAMQAFRASGFDAYNLGGGLKAWDEDGRDLETD